MCIITFKLDIKILYLFFITFEQYCDIKVIFPEHRIIMILFSIQIREKYKTQYNLNRNSLTFPLT